MSLTARRGVPSTATRVHQGTSDDAGSILKLSALACLIYATTSMYHHENSSEEELFGEESRESSEAVFS